MALRFRRSIRLAPGVRLNLSDSGLGVSVGPRGASVSIGPRGVYGYTGIPGIGLYARKRLDGGKSARRRGARSSQSGSTAPQNLEVKARLQDDGTVQFVDENHPPFPVPLKRVAKKQQGERVRAWRKE